AFRMAIELDSRFANAYGNLGTAHFHLGQSLRSQGKLDEAIAEFRQMLTLVKKMPAGSPRLPQSQFSLANLLNDRAWQLVTADDPKHRNPKRAIDLAEEAATLAPSVAFVFCKTLGVAHFRAGNWKAAALALEKSRQLNPHNPYYRNDSVILFFL